MIPANVITAWAATHSWPTRAQVEQDFLLSQVLIAIAADDFLGEELAFRGGTALHKIHLDRPYRYSEDLDFVRSTAGSIAELTRALTRLGEALGFEVRTRISEHPKVYLRAASESGVRLRIKLEVNTHERSPALPHIRIPHQVTSMWWSGSADVLTFQPAELVATKIRALYQRSKGRDLFDLWLALTELHLEPDAILAAFGPYCPEGLTAKQSVNNLQRKVADPTFRSDLVPLLSSVPTAYAVDAAAELVIQQLLKRL